MRTSIDTGTLIDLIASGLPEFILNRIDREILKETTDLFNEVSKYEHMIKERKKYQIEEKAKSSEITYTLRNNEENKEILKECKVNFNEHVKEEDFKIKINYLDENMAQYLQKINMMSALFMDMKPE
ncbi:unnamed protein product [Arctia plantaginis]|uniref:Uncharacterized protein n=1 Tax=Arctia plantaginis TaxID=874455 RepID=A0A8S1ANA1_ARCPL|nr:unnamed protein product [Arctia plantaginis]